MDKSLEIQKEKLWKIFILSLGIAILGTGIGNVLHFSLSLPLEFYNLIISLTALLFRKIKKINYTVLCLCSFLTGVFISPLITYYVRQGGWVSILLSLFIAMLFFAFMAESGWETEKNLSYWNENLFSALLALVILLLLSLFFSLGSAGRLVMSFANLFIFCGYVKYDFNMMKHSNFTEKDIPLIAFNLYLSYLNLSI